MLLNRPHNSPLFIRNQRIANVVSTNDDKVFI